MVYKQDNKSFIYAKKQPVEETIILAKKEYDVLAKKEYNDAKPFREVRYVKTNKGTEFFVVREGVETWLSMHYLDVIVENGRQRRQQVLEAIRNGKRTY